MGGITIFGIGYKPFDYGFNVYFENGKGEKTDTVNKKTNSDFVKVFKFGKGMKPLR